MQQSNRGDIHAQGSFQAQTLVLGHQNNTTINYHNFPDWEALQREKERYLTLYQRYPNDPDIPQHLQKVQEQIESFQQEVLKLAEDFKRIPLNTQRLRDAYAAFEQGDLHTVRVLLRAPEVEQEKDALLQRRAQLANQTEENEQHLTDKANEFILLARATALDFSLGEERIPQTCAAYEQALECQRSPKNLFNYAYFLAAENQRLQAQVHYEEALALRRQLASQQPAVYEPEVARTLNNLANLLAEDASQRTLAQGYYEEALALRRRLATQQAAVYAPEVASSLNNLALLLAEDASQRALAQGYYEASLELYRRLAGQQPAVYEPAVADSLNNLANLLAKDASQRALAQGYYEASLELYRRLAHQQPNLYNQDLANALSDQGYAYLQWNEPQNALPYLEEALQLLHPFYELHPNIYGEKYESFQTVLAYCRQPLEPET